MCVVCPQKAQAISGGVDEVQWLCREKLKFQHYEKSFQRLLLLKRYLGSRFWAWAAKNFFATA